MPSAKSLIITGFMGTGKTTVAGLVAEHLKRPLVSIDDQIEAAAGKPIARIFTEEGEATFRKLEAQICQEHARKPGLVISTGGGSLINDETRAVCVAHGIVVCLSASLVALQQRVGQSDPTRPLFNNPQQVEDLYKQRKPIYDSLPHQIDTTNLSPEAVSQEVIRLCQQHASV